VLKGEVKFNTTFGFIKRDFITFGLLKAFTVGFGTSSALENPQVRVKKLSKNSFENYKTNRLKAPFLNKL